MKDGDILSNFEIGQIVLIVSDAHSTIIPGMIVEECVVKKLSGNTVSWKVKVGSPNNSKIVDTAKIKGEIYGNLDEVAESMQKNLNEFIKKTIGEARERIELWFGKEVAERQNNSMITHPVDDGGKIDADTLLNSLEGTPGQKFMARPEPTPLVSEAVAKETLRNNLRKLAEAEEESSSVMVTDDQGNRVAVKMPKVLA